MKKPIFLILILLIFLSLACGFNFSTAAISEAKMAKDPDGQQPTTVFSPDEAFYAVVELNNAPDDTTVKAVWIAVEVEGTEPNLSLDEAAVTSGDGTLQFDLTSQNPWPAGKYKVELYLNDKLDHTLEFEVEGESVAQQPSPTPEPTASPTPKPTATPEPTATPRPTAAPVNSAGDSLTTVSVEQPIEAAEEYDPLPLQADRYIHPSGAFSFAVPESWELISEDETSAMLGIDPAVVGATYLEAGRPVTEKEMQDFLNSFIDRFVNTFGEDYEIIKQETLSDDSIYVALSYTSSTTEDGDIDFFFEQRETVIYTFYFVTSTYEELEPTWHEIIASYSVDPQAVIAKAPTATPTRPAPKPTPVPANPFMPQAGRSRLYVFNEFNQELTFTINNKEHKIPPAGIDHPIPIDLDPGRYTYTISIPGGAANGEVTLAANQSWAVGVRGDSAVYNPFQVYP